MRPIGPSHQVAAELVVAAVMLAHHSAGRGLSPKITAAITASIASHTASDAPSPGEISSALVWSSLRVRPCSFGSTILCSDFRACSNETSAAAESLVVPPGT